MRKLNNLILIIFTLLLILPLCALAIGQVSKPIVIENALKGEEYEDILTLYNSSDDNEIFDLSIEGEIAEWAEFYSLDDLEMLISIKDIKVQANSKIKARVKFSIPADMSNGIYKGVIIVSLSPKNMESREKISTLITQQVPRNVSITVTGEQVLSCRAFVVPQNYKLDINESLKTNISCFNTGNVKIKPLIQQKIIKDGRIIFNVIHPYPENKEGIKPKHSETLTVEWQPSNQESGEYRAETKILLNNEVMEENDFRFILGSVNSDTEKSNIDKFLGMLSAIGGSNPTLGWFIIGGIFLIIAQILIIINRRKNREGKH